MLAYYRTNVDGMSITIPKSGTMYFYINDYNSVDNGASVTLEFTASAGAAAGQFGAVGERSGGSSYSRPATELYNFATKRQLTVGADLVFAHQFRGEYKIRLRKHIHLTADWF